VSYTIGNVVEVLPSLESDRFQACVTSPPYWGLRDYDHPDQLGLEATPEEYIARMVEVFREVRRTLRHDGVLWLNIGDSYAGSRAARIAQAARAARPRAGFHEAPVEVPPPAGLKDKDLVGIPWMLAFALRADGWYLRSDTIWAKPNPMPESVDDRPTKAHEYVFLLAKSASYFFDAAAIAEDAVSTRRSGNRERQSRQDAGGILGDGRHQKTHVPWADVGGKRNARSVWSIAAQPYAGAHFAVMPLRLAERCVLSATRIGDEVLDPFLGSGTTALAAQKHGRRWYGIDVQPKYEPLIRERTIQDGLLSVIGARR
jgi:DNA modification methylase